MGTPPFKASYLFENAPENHERKDIGEQIGGGLGQQDAGEAQQGGQGGDGRRKEDALTGQGKGKRTGSVAHCLADAGDDQGKAEQQGTYLHDSQHVHAGLDHERIIHEGAHQERRGQKQNESEAGPKPRFQQDGETNGPAETLAAAAAVRVAEKRLAAMESELKRKMLES